MKDFTDWLIKKVRARGWSNNELGRQVGVSSSAISFILTGKQKPSLQLCMKIAQVLDKSPIYVLRRAGLLPPASADELSSEASNLTEIEQKMLRALRNLPVDDQELIANAVCVLARRPTRTEQEILDIFRELQAHDRETIIEMMHVLEKKGR